MQPDITKLNQYSGVNYMKRSDKSGVAQTNTTNISIGHELGYPPQFSVYADLLGDGMIWYGAERVTASTESTAGAGTPAVYTESWVTDTALTIKPNNFGGNRNVYWLIYLDYGV